MYEYEYMIIDIDISVHGKCSCMYLDQVLLNIIYYPSKIRKNCISTNYFCVRRLFLVETLRMVTGRKFDVVGSLDFWGV